MKENIDEKKCFECGLEDEFIANHHVVPKLRGGTKTVPLCMKCHGLVHGKNFMNTSTLTREGLAAAKRRGVKLGSPDPERSVKLMLAGAQAAKKEFKSKMLPVVNEIMATGVKTLQGVADELERIGYLTRQGKTKWHPGTVRYVLLD